MAVSNASSSSAVSSGLDVAAIVSGLMSVERQPADKLDAKIADVTTQISALGEIKSALSTFQTAVADLENTGLFATRTTSSTDTTAVTAKATSAASTGTHHLKVLQTATSAQTSISGFPSADAEIDLTDFSMLVGGTTYTEDDFDSGLTISEFKTAINALDAGVTARLTEQSSGSYVLTLTTTSTGAAQVLAISGLATVDDDSLLQTQLSTPRDAFLSVDGVIYQRAVNEIDDIVNGVTVSLVSPVVPETVIDGMAVGSVDGVDTLVATSGGDTIGSFSALLSPVSTVVIGVVDGSADRSESLIRDFVTSYNDLVTKVADQTKRSSTASERGVLVNDSFLDSYIQRVRDFYFQGITLADGSVVSMASFGVDAQLDGTLQINEITFSDALSGDLKDTLAAGITVGRESATSSLNSFLRTSLRTTGIFSSHVSDLQDRQARLETDKTRLEDRLIRVEARLYSQYSALDALLMRMQVTSNALTSAIDSLVANQGK